MKIIRLTMCVTVIQDLQIKSARKDHNCDACMFMRENLGEIGNGKLSFSELRAIAKAKQDGYKIKKGQPYGKQFNSMDGDGDTYTFKYRPEIHNLCLKYGLYPEC